MIERTSHVARVVRRLRQFPVVGILGTRQIGKTTLARQVASSVGGKVHRFDLESPSHLARLRDPQLALSPLRGLVVLDEVHRRPEIFPLLRVLADRPLKPARFLVLGSASPGLLRQTSESLAGRISYYDLEGFSVGEVGVRHADRLWVRGGFPLSYLASNDAESLQWRNDFLRTFLERDLPQFGGAVSPVTLGRFWSMLAHYHGQLWNGSELAGSLGVSLPTVRRYLDLLQATFVVRVLPPWHENIAKRQVKAPKVFIADSGLLHALLGITDDNGLFGHPKCGASWEGFAMSQVVARLQVDPRNCWFWRTHKGAELDLLVVRGRQRLGFEFERTDAPRLTPSMRSALETLHLDRLDVIYPGHESFPMDKSVRAVALRRLLQDVKPLR